MDGLETPARPGEQDIAEPTIIDADILLAAKENIQPISKGRRATALSAVFSTPLVKRDAQLNRQRQLYREQVVRAKATGSADECLEAYNDFVQWTIESYPQGHSIESGIVELLEEATRFLREHYLDELRHNETYFNLWIQYKSYVERPLIVFAFLLSNDIGTNFATFYESYADELERESRLKEADEIHNLGIARNAEPLSHLEGRYRKFQRRMMASDNLTPPEEPDVPPTPGPLTAPRKRSVLQNANPAMTGPRTLQSQEDDVFTSSVVPSTAAASQRPNGRLEVFADDAVAESSGAARQGTWNDLGTKKARVKENRPQITKAGDGVPLSTKKTRRVPSTPSKFVPFEDALPAVESAADDSIDILTRFASVKTPAKSSIVPFCDPVDEDDEEDAPHRFPPKTPSHRGKPSIEQNSLMMPSTINNNTLQSKATRCLTETEALRKNPLKNYEAQ